MNRVIKVVAVLLLFIISFGAAGQPADHELPLPQMKGVSMAVKMHFSFMESRIGRDTESVFLIGADGYAHTRYFCEEGLCSGKETYEYQDGRLIRISRYNTLDRHTLFAPPRMHSHRLISEDSWEYRGGKVSVERHTLGSRKTLTREIRYEYDREGRITAEHHEYPKQAMLYYPVQYDYVQYQYAGDSVCRMSYEKGKLKDSIVYLERHNSAGLITESMIVSPDEMHFERELRQYDSSGRITELASFGNQPAVKDDGTVLRAERVEYTYDDLGRPDEVRCYARYIKRWAFKYTYLR